MMRSRRDESLLPRIVARHRYCPLWCGYANTRRGRSSNAARRAKRLHALQSRAVGSTPRDTLQLVESLSAAERTIVLRALLELAITESGFDDQPDREERADHNFRPDQIADL